MILCSLGPLKFQELTISSLSQTLLYSNTLIYKEKNNSLMQLLNMFYSLKDSMSLLFRRFSLESLNPSRYFFQDILLHLLLISFSHIFAVTLIIFSLLFKFFPGTFEFEFDSGECDCLVYCGV